MFSMRYSVPCKVYTGYHVTSKDEHGLSVLTVDNPLAKPRRLFLHTGGKPCSISPRTFTVLLVLCLAISGDLCGIKDKTNLLVVPFEVACVIQDQAPRL